MLKKLTKYLQVAAGMLCGSEDRVKFTCTTRDWCNLRCCIGTVYVGRVIHDKLERMGSRASIRYDDWLLNREKCWARTLSV